MKSNGKSKANINEWSQRYYTLIRDLPDEVPPDIESNLLQAKLMLEDYPRQLQIRAVFDKAEADKTSPPLEWLVKIRKENFDRLSLQWCLLPPEDKEDFIEGLVDYWRDYRRTEDLAEAILAKHRAAQ
jgi:hypothetical protein